MLSASKKISAARISPKRFVKSIQKLRSVSKEKRSCFLNQAPTSERVQELEDGEVSDHDDPSLMKRNRADEEFFEAVDTPFARPLKAPSDGSIRIPPFASSIDGQGMDVGYKHLAEVALNAEPRFAETMAKLSHFERYEARQKEDWTYNPTWLEMCDDNPQEAVAALQAYLFRSKFNFEHAKQVGDDFHDLAGIAQQVRDHKVYDTVLAIACFKPDPQSSTGKPKVMAPPSYAVIGTGGDPPADIATSGGPTATSGTLVLANQLRPLKSTDKTEVESWCALYKTLRTSGMMIDPRSYIDEFIQENIISGMMLNFRDDPSLTRENCFLVNDFVKFTDRMRVVFCSDATKDRSTVLVNLRSSRFDLPSPTLHTGLDYQKWVLQRLRAFKASSLYAEVSPEAVVALFKGLTAQSENGTPVPSVA
jgi:hypothetical protein